MNEFTTGQRLKGPVRVTRYRFGRDHCPPMSAFRPIATVNSRPGDLSRCATCGRNSIENLSPTTDVEISSSSIFGSTAIDASAETHPSSCVCELDRQRGTHNT